MVDVRSQKVFDYPAGTVMALDWEQPIFETEDIGSDIVVFLTCEGVDVLMGLEAFREAFCMWDDDELGTP